MVYCHTTASSDGAARLDLSYASPEEQRWWRALVSRGIGWSISNQRISPWATSIVDMGIYVDAKSEGASEFEPPTASQAASYLSRLCAAYNLGIQSSAALAATLILPLHATAASSEVISLPRPAFASRASSPGLGNNLADFANIGYLMTLISSEWAIGHALRSAFWAKEVSCTVSGAWTLPIAHGLQHVIRTNSMETLAEALSITDVAPLWLGLALCGSKKVINRIRLSLVQLHDYPLLRPSIDASAWTKATASFLDQRYTIASGTDGVSRAAVWRLRHNCSTSSPSHFDFSIPPPHGWPPFGKMKDGAVEL